MGTLLCCNFMPSADDWTTTMSHADNHLIRLQDLRLFQAAGSLDDSLVRQAALTAGLVSAESCSIMLLNHGDGNDPRMRVCATHGPLPDAALGASIGSGEGISGQVLASGRALLVTDLGASPLAPLARRPDDLRRSLMCAPIHVDARVVGVVNVCGAQGKDAFTETDLHLLDVLALFIGKSIQVLQLQGLLDSRFAQLALLREVEGSVAAGDTGQVVLQGNDQSRLRVAPDRLRCLGTDRTTQQ
jgi:L-methionine (R)-S-oxide reductase